MSAPTFREAIKALEMSGDDDEANIAAVLEGIEYQHGPDRERRCSTCTAPWPCAEWVRGEGLAVLWIGRAADRVYARAVARVTTRPAS